MPALTHEDRGGEDDERVVRARLDAEAEELLKEYKGAVAVLDPKARRKGTLDVKAPRAARSAALMRDLGREEEALALGEALARVGEAGDGGVGAGGAIAHPLGFREARGDAVAFRPQLRAGEGGSGGGCMGDR
jgi:hypothetical protein